jgi:hypothetical protein
MLSVSPFQLLKWLTGFHESWLKRHVTKSTEERCEFSAFCHKNMVDVQICQAAATPAPRNKLQRLNVTHSNTACA